MPVSSSIEMKMKPFAVPGRCRAMTQRVAAVLYALDCIQRAHATEPHHLFLVDAYNDIYTYDAEGRVSGISGTNSGNYVYDAEGNRVEKSASSVTDYIDFGGRQIARLSGGQWTDLIYGVNGLLAEVPGTQAGTPVYRMLDHLGTQVGTLSSTGTLLSATDYAPFGQTFTGGTQDPYQFTGKERDTESGLDYFGARYYGSSMGRFMSADWIGALNQSQSHMLTLPILRPSICIHTLAITRLAAPTRTVIAQTAAIKRGSGGVSFTIQTRTKSATLRTSSTTTRFIGPDSVSHHDYPHINYHTSDGTKGTIRIQKAGQ